MDLQLRWRWSSLTHREGLALIEANLKTKAWKQAYISRRQNCFPSLSDMTRPKNEPRNSMLMMCHPDLSSAFVWLKICCIQVYLLRHFDISCGSPLYKLDRVLVWGPHLSRVPYLGLHQKQVERPPRNDVRNERAGPLQEVQGACWPWRR